MEGATPQPASQATVASRCSTKMARSRTAESDKIPLSPKMLANLEFAMHRYTKTVDVRPADVDRSNIARDAINAADRLPARHACSAAHHAAPRHPSRPSRSPRADRRHAGQHDLDPDAGVRPVRSRLRGRRPP